MDKDELKREKRKIEDLYYEKEKKYAKLDEQTEMFHNWINQTKESMVSIQKGWKSEESNLYFSQLEDEVNHLQSKNLKLAEENEEERIKAKEGYLNCIDQIDKKIREDNEEDGKDASI